MKWLKSSLQKYVSGIQRKTTWDDWLLCTYCQMVNSIVVEVKTDSVGFWMLSVYACIVSVCVFICLCDLISENFSDSSRAVCLLCACVSLF